MSVRAQRVDLDRVQRGREGGHLGQRRLGCAGRVGEAEVLLEGVVPVRVLPGQVEVGVVPGDPAGRAGQQAVVQDVPVVAGGVRARGEVGADPELLEHHRPAERAGQLALPGGRVVLPDPVIAHRVDVRAEEVAQPGDVGEPEPVVAAAGLDAPGAVAERRTAGDRRPRAPRP